MTDPRSLVLVVEDEPQVQRFLRASLEANNFRIQLARTSAEALALASANNPELVLLDLGLPDGDGVELTRRLREFTKTPIIVVSARGLEEDKVQALDAGADDYLTKPFGVGELLARMRVALRHADAARAGDAPPTIEVGDLKIDRARRVVTKGGEEVHLTPIEYKLLALLAEHAGKVLTHRQILRDVWGPTYAAQSHYVRVHMAELRKKIEDEPARPKLIVTEPGVGYRLKG